MLTRNVFPTKPAARAALAFVAALPVFYQAFNPPAPSTSACWGWRGQTMRLTPVAGSPFPAGAGGIPAGIRVTPEGKFLAVARLGSNTVSMYSVSSAGGLTPVPGSPFQFHRAERRLHS
jgi:hypothetical protein